MTVVYLVDSVFRSISLFVLVLGSELIRNRYRSNEIATSVKTLAATVTLAMKLLTVQ